MPYSPVEIRRRFGGTYLPVLLLSRKKPNVGGKQSDCACVGPADGSINSAEISVNFCRIIRLYISQNTALNNAMLDETFVRNIEN
jgi:hypothetical protein